MTLSTRVRYAVRLMADIAAHGSPGKAVPLREVAARQGLSRVYLSQLAIPLRNASLLRSVWGNKGGFLLGRPAAEITVLDIAEAVDGPICIIDCAVDPNYCGRSSRCEAIGLWRRLNADITRILASQTVESLVAGKCASAELETGCAAGTKPASRRAACPAARLASAAPDLSSSRPSSGAGLKRGGHLEKENPRCRR